MTEEFVNERIEAAFERLEHFAPEYATVHYRGGSLFAISTPKPCTFEEEIFEAIADAELERLRIREGELFCTTPNEVEE